MSATSIEAYELAKAIERWQNAPDDLTDGEYLAMVREIAARAGDVAVDWPARSITPCEQAPFGSYRNHIALPVPPGLGIGGETGAVGLDYCIAHEVYGLWGLGIRTRASCCGHGKMRGFVAVDERDEGRMEALGYEGERNEFGVMCWWTKTGCEPTDTEGER